MLQARKADMGADLSRAIMNSVVTQISNGWNPSGANYYFVAGEVAEKLKGGLGALGLSDGQQEIVVNDNRTFNGDDDVAFAEGDDNTIQVFPNNNELIGTGYYTSCATVVSLGGGYYEVTGLAVYRYNKDSDATDFKRGSYAFFADDSGINRWYKIENVAAVTENTGRGRTGTTTTSLVTMIGDKGSGEVQYLGDVIGISRKVVRIDSYTTDN